MLTEFSDVVRELDIDMNESFRFRNPRVTGVHETRCTHRDLGRVRTPCHPLTPHDEQLNRFPAHQLNVSNIIDVN